MHGDRYDAVGDDIHPAHFELGAGRVVAELHVSAQRSGSVGDITGRFAGVFSSLSSRRYRGLTLRQVLLLICEIVHHVCEVRPAGTNGEGRTRSLPGQLCIPHGGRIPFACPFSDLALTGVYELEAQEHDRMEHLASDARLLRRHVLAIAGFDRCN